MLGPSGQAAQSGGRSAGKSAPTAAAAAQVASLVRQAQEAKKRGELQGAAVKYWEALQLDRDNEEAHWGYAWVLAEQGKNFNARAEFQRVLQLTNDPERRREAGQAIDRLSTWRPERGDVRPNR